ncbi:MAG: hypothetical protein AAF614_32000 [Chloroflexota bacterium]
MRRLTDLLATEAGRDFLRAESVFTDSDAFARAVVVPKRPFLLEQFNRPLAPLVYSGQQPYVDYRQSVVGKMTALAALAKPALAQLARLETIFLWLDTDRAGSDNLITKFGWPNSSKKGMIRVAPAGINDTEIRHVTMTPEAWTLAMDRLYGALGNLKQRNPQAKQRYALLKEEGLRQTPQELGLFNQALSHFLLSQTATPPPPSGLMSRVLQSGLLCDGLDELVNHLPHAIAVFNRTVQRLQACNINPQVRELPPDFFPLFYTCQRDNQRQRLRLWCRHGDHYAITRCKKCGTDYRFYLGKQKLSTAEITNTGRWSVNVMLPILMNPFTSGMVAGKSSALYGIVLNAILREVLCQKPIPMLVPTSMAPANDEPDSLLYRYFHS